ncbi:MAG: class I tRNA ligase family protein, partial [Actinomycetota bacterium]|nr:class I tRNA ligase family protein [Actinomycetota bacterium]
KMSKSKGNTVSPRDYVERYGADTLRCYILFVGHPAEGGDWSDEGIAGIQHFLSRLWRAATDAVERTEPSSGPTGQPTELLRKAHWAIDKVTRDLGERFATHTSIAAVMELVNDIFRHRDALAEAPEDASQLRFAVATAASLVFPFAPHLGSEVYELITRRRVWEEPWPQADPSLLVADVIQLIVQLNGKLIDRLEMPADASEEEQERIARASEKLAARLDGRQVVKTIVVPRKLVNFVAR